MTTKMSPSECLIASDILTDEICALVVKYSEENEHVDFKESFDLKLGKSWVELAIDCVAFANSQGGYVVFGVQNSTWKLVGVSKEVADALTDTKQVLEQVNRNLVPAITGLRARRIEIEGTMFVVIAVPPTLERTHIFEGSRDWKTPSGSTLPLVAKGAIYIRRSATNQVMTSVDFEQLIERRFKRQREKLLEGLTRVINAPLNHDVVTLARVDSAKPDRAFIVSDAPNALEIRGQQIQLAADNVVSLVEALRSVSAARPETEIDRSILYSAYAERESAHFREDQVAWLALQSLICGAPPFCWLARMRKANARDTIKQSFELARSGKASIVPFAGFYGRALHEQLRSRIAGASKPRAFTAKRALLSVSKSLEPDKDARRATELARSLENQHDTHSRRQLEVLDCALYAPFDEDE